MNFKKHTLNYSDKELEEFPKEIFSTARVHKLNLSHNKIKEIPKEISKLKYLETLDLSYNQIRHLKAGFFDLPNLKILILNDNVIINIPKQIRKFDKLKILSLANNRISAIPDDIVYLENLEELNLTGNLLENLPITGTKSFMKLKALWIADNPLTFLTSEDLQKAMPNLKALYCYTPKMVKVLKSTDRGIIAGGTAKGNCIAEIRISDASQNAREDESKIISGKNTTVIPTPTPLRKLMPKIFISYSHLDETYLKRLKVHLKILGREVEFDYWDDTRLKSGDKWRDEIKKALDSASNAILLVSTDFLASDFIFNEELQPLLKAAELKGTRIHPVIIKPCSFLDFKSLSAFQAINDPSKALSECEENQRERIWMKLCNQMKESFSGAMLSKSK